MTLGKRLHHGPITVDGHTFYVDMSMVPPTREAYAKWYKGFEAWAREEIKKMEVNNA